MIIWRQQIILYLTNVCAKDSLNVHFISQRMIIGKSRLFKSQLIVEIKLSHLFKKVAPMTNHIWKQITDFVVAVRALKKQKKWDVNKYYKNKSYKVKKVIFASKSSHFTFTRVD